MKFHIRRIGQWLRDIRLELRFERTMGAAFKDADYACALTRPMPLWMRIARMFWRS